MNVLIVVDVQYDFLPGGSLAVSDGAAVIPVINEMMPKFDLVVATQDWHPSNHLSFASNHKDKKVGDLIQLQGLQQVLWPDHCVQESKGAEFHKDLKQQRIEQIFKKGTDSEIDSYSGFYDNGHLKNTGLTDYLKNKHVSSVFICGLATDYCVKYTALDAISEGFKTVVILDATRAVNLQPDDFEMAVKEMKESGVKVINSYELDKRA